MRILIVKLSSMGDIVHTLPAITDAIAAYPDIEFDWVVDQAFAEIPTWHPQIKSVIKSYHRQWKKNKWSSFFRGSIIHFIRELRSRNYDLVIDAQSSLKSALITRMAKGPRVGMDRDSVREYGAQWAYQKRVKISKNQHAITRIRELFSSALNYSVPKTLPNYSINRNKLLAPPFNIPEKFIFLVTNASWETKLWPESYWMQLIKKIADLGYEILLTWGNTTEEERVKRLAATNPNAVVLPKLSLSELAYIISHARAAISVDTGVAHIAAALDIPGIAIYGATNPELIGTVGKNQAHLTAKFPCAPCNQKVCSYQGKSLVRPACYEEITPDQVISELMRFFKI